MKEIEYERSTALAYVRSMRYTLQQLFSEDIPREERVIVSAELLKWESRLHDLISMGGEIT